MGERKVLNKYVPWDFDPRRLPKGKRAANNVMNVRMMLPFSFQCLACGEFMGAGKKFNSRKEDCQGMNYLGIQIVRFIQKCPACGSKFSFRTDPEHADYQVEWGAKRLAQNLLKEVDFGEEEDEEKEQEDAMTALESRTLESRRQMDILDALDEIKSMNQRVEHLDNDQIVSMALKSKYNETDEGITEEEEKEVRELFKKKKPIAELSDSEEEEKPQADATGMADLLDKEVTKKQEDTFSTPQVVVRVAKKPKEESSKKKRKKSKKAKKEKEPQNKLSSLLGYGSGSDSEDSSAKRQRV